MNYKFVSDTVNGASLAQFRIDGKPLGDKQISILFRLVSARLMSMLAARVESYGLNHNSYIAMMTLYGSPEQQLNPSELSALIGETRGNMTRICDELTEKGLLVRVPSPEDRRRVNLSLSDKGKALIVELAPKLNAHNQLIYEAFSKEEKDAAIAFMTKLCNRLDDIK